MEGRLLREADEASTAQAAQSRLWDRKWASAAPALPLCGAVPVLLL